MLAEIPSRAKSNYLHDIALATGLQKKGAKHSRRGDEESARNAL
jgi:hypothetical protein